MITSIAYVTLRTPNLPDVTYSFEVQHESVYNGLQTAILMLGKGVEIKKQSINAGFKSANLDLGDGRKMFVEVK